MNKKYIVVSILPLLSMYICGCRGPELQSDWAAESIAIDGNDGDWESISPHNVEGLMVSIRLCNDAENLYLLLRAENPMTSRYLRGRGVTLSFNAGSDDEPLLALFYTGGDTFMPGAEPGDSFWEALSPDQKQRYRDRQQEIRQSIRIIQKGIPLQIPPDGSRGPAAASLLLRDASGYEFKIPLQPGDSRPYALNSLPGEVINIGVIVGDSETEEMRPTEFPGEPMEGMRGGGDMEGMGGRGGGGMMPGRRLPEKREAWFKVILSGASHSPGESHRPGEPHRSDISPDSAALHHPGEPHNRPFKE